MPGIGCTHTDRVIIIAFVAFAKKLRRLPLTLKLELLISGFPALECQCVLASFHKTEQVCRFSEVSTEKEAWHRLIHQPLWLWGCSEWPFKCVHLQRGSRNQGGEGLGICALDALRLILYKLWKAMRKITGKHFKTGITHRRRLAVWPLLRCSLRFRWDLLLDVSAEVPDLTHFNFPSAIRVLDQIGPDAAVSEANLRYEEIPDPNVKHPGMCCA